MDTISDRLINQAVVDRWMDEANLFIERMNEITLEWMGYDEDPKIDKEMLGYVNRSDKLLVDLAMSNGNTAKLALSEVHYAEEGHIRVMLTALLTMDKGMLGKRLVSKLLWLTFSLTLLLLLTLLIRTITGPEHINLFVTSESFDLFMYFVLPAVATSHIVGFIIAVRVWLREVQKREDAWGSPRRRIVEVRCAEHSK